VYITNRIPFGKPIYFFTVSTVSAVGIHDGLDTLMAVLVAGLAAGLMANLKFSNQGISPKLMNAAQ
jgi:UDP-N-acetylmuramyl pentapeptide phosphotransferase/UDP-N-acetylglucosamine-1-phosphate transferase